jgi:pRiA4b ORF-3-like protein
LTEVTGKCLPEDVGGFPGYYEFIDAMPDPKHPEHDHLKDWYGGTFDPNLPDTDELKLEVLKLAKRWKPKKPRG